MWRGEAGLDSKGKHKQMKQKNRKESKLADTEEKQQEICSTQYPFLTTRHRKSHFKRTAKNVGPDKSDKDAIATRSKCWREVIEGGKAKE